MKSVLISIQPYWVFLIIARLMGWNIPQEKTVEVRKDFPKDKAWNKRVHIYCSKNRKSFNRIPKWYQPLMENLLGKVIGEFVCDSISILPAIFITKNVYGASENAQRFASESCLTQQELIAYCGTNNFLYGWRIFNLVIYDKPKKLGEFKRNGEYCDNCKHLEKEIKICNKYDAYLVTNDWLEWYFRCDKCQEKNCKITHPPQSWGYVEEL